MRGRIVLMLQDAGLQIGELPFCFFYHTEIQLADGTFVGTIAMHTHHAEPAFQGDDFFQKLHRPLLAGARL